jgi:hypothetical protein
MGLNLDPGAGAGQWYLVSGKAVAVVMGKSTDREQQTANPPPPPPAPTTRDAVEPK